METPTQTRVEADYAEIRRTALDYIEGWYDGDTGRMERRLHPQLAKRIVEHNASGSLGRPPRDRLDETSGRRLVQNTRHDPVPVRKRRTDVTILDRFENAASVRVDAQEWIDYLHMTKWNSRWLIVNVLWELRPESQTA